MPATSADRDLVIGVTPFHEPNAALVVAVGRAGFLGVLDLGPDAAEARAALEHVRRRLGRPFGVRISEARLLEDLPLEDLPLEVDTVLVETGLIGATRFRGAAEFQGSRRVLAEVTSSLEAVEALRCGASGLVARGCEAGGRVGELSTFVLLQQLIGEFDVPVWAAGGIGPHTATAAVAGGARGVVVDAQLALVAEAGLPRDVATAITAMDGSETKVIAGYRVYTRPDLPSLEPGTARFGARDLREHLLPVGQDGAFAAPLARRFKTAGGVVQAIGAAITSQIELATRTEPLKDATAVQGPMTRVSDRAEFAASVANAGGLPFLALALMSGDQARELLIDTARLLGDLPWGVGILGFAPPELRAAQLEAIRDIRPPYALIAGGRPSQAAGLEDAGIETFLHVPSPGLLDRFLKDGARRFVFEGSECGGHIGPRTSFALWEAQIERLLKQKDLGEVRVWFAGGVHDERSAAMVAAMAAPLAERGARVSVLMGTAYLFTQEAVRFGAIVPGYQGTARDCTATSLLESSPGHVIRCADTPYVSAFAEAKQLLARDGASQRETWASLERLSLGRLRTAAKGLRRDGETLVPVDENTARAEGMYMLGQVAALRSEVTTAAALHEQVTAGATRFLAARALDLDTGGRDTDDSRRPASHADARPLDVAIVGMACVYPGADSLGAYWANIVSGMDAITDVPPERWQPQIHPDLPRRGGFVPRVPFDALSYGIPPSSLASIEPVQLLALEVAARALADAGYAVLPQPTSPDRPPGRPFDRERTSVIFGAEPGSDLSAAYGLRSVLPGYLGRLPAELDEHLPGLTEDSFPGVLGNVIAGRIANRLDLGGVNYSVDAACASSLAALDLACKELVSGTSDMVLCGGADTHNGIHDYEMFASVHALSENGRCATFDAAADGIALGEGAACVVLKRLADAERDGDRVYAVVKGVGGSSDGRSLGLTAPRPEGQRRALDRAYAMAGVSPAEVGLIEAHGTGTVVGDRAELATLTAVFAGSGAEPGNCAIGSVKSQIGHTKCAAGLAGLIKAAFAVHAGVRPGTLHLNEPNPYWDRASSPFTFTSGPWAVPPAGRHAGVSAFGFGGTNFHAVLSGYDGADEPLHGLRDWPAELIVFRGDVAAAADDLRRLLAANDAAGRPWRLAQLAATMAAKAGPVRDAFTADDLDDLAAKLRQPVEPRTGRQPDATVAFLFPGQGSQRPGMAGDLFTAFPRLQRLLRLGTARSADGTERYADVMFPPVAFTRDERERQKAAITDTRMAQPTLGIAGLAMHELLTMVGVRPGMAAGHSYGELLALCAAGVFSEADLLQLSEVRARCILDAAGRDPGAMASVSAPPPQIGRWIGELPGVVVANYNAPDQTVISGPTSAIEAAMESLAARRISVRRLPVACAFHSPLVAAAAATMAGALSGRDIGAPAFPVYANSTAAPYPDAPDAVRRILAAQVAEPVRFTEQIEAMYEAGARTFVEAGPGRVLTGLVDRILGGRPHTAVACDVPGENGLRRFVLALADLVRAGVPVDPEPLFAGRAAPAVEAPEHKRWTVDGHLVRTADGSPVPGGLRPATAAPRLSLGSPRPADRNNSGSNGNPASGRDHVIMEFLRTTRELVAAQREVLLGYLGGATPTVPTAPLPAPDKQPAHMEPMERTERNRHPVPAELEPVAASTALVSAAPAPVRLLRRPELADAVVAVIAARTGYPLDMLRDDLDLEADLSIDSIKRTEVIAALAERLRVTNAPAGETTAAESMMEELAQVKTIRGITDWFAARTGQTAALAGTTELAVPGRAAIDEQDHPQRVRHSSVVSHEPDSAGRTAGGPAGANAPVAASVIGGAMAPAGRPRRYVVQAVDLVPSAGDRAIEGRFLIVDDGRGIALELADLLEQRGAQAITSEAPGAGELAAADALVHLGALRPGAQPVLPGGFALVRDALTAGAGTVLLVTADGGTFGIGSETAAREPDGSEPGDSEPGHRGPDGPEPDSSVPCDLGLRGMMRTIAAEYPRVLARAVDVEPKESPRILAAQLLAELSGKSGPPVVGYRAGRRRALRLVESRAPVPSRGPAQSGDIGLDAESVVLLTGGARGITASVALALARSAGCHIELIGRTPPPGPVDPETSGVINPGELRRILIERGMRTPREIEAAVAGVQRDREMRATLDGLRQAAASVRYHTVDVRDGAAVGALMDDIYARYGRLDGVIHGAGVLEDRLVPDKTAESFSRVYETKVSGARAVMAGLHGVTRHADTRHGDIKGDIRFFVLFGSVSGVLGNRGQADYSAANDALDTLAHLWSVRCPGRVVAVDWGPWAGGGMVSAELEREYARRGVTLIDPGEGVACLLAEIAAGSGPAQVVYLCDEVSNE